MLELGRTGSAGGAKGVIPVLRDGVAIGQLQASNGKEAATAVVGEREWVSLEHQVILLWLELVIGRRNQAATTGVTVAAGAVAGGS